jgi:cytochrome c peroxidase
VSVARASIAEAKKEGRDVVILDTAGRLAIDDELMNELSDVNKAVTPHQIYLVLDVLGPYNDDPTRSTATGTRHVRLEHRNFGEFRTPSLRKLALTAPYMHNGRLATLRDVVDHYSTISPDRLHSDGEAILRPLRLEAGEARDLVLFLQTLQEEGGRYARRALPPDCR